MRPSHLSKTQDYQCSLDQTPCAIAFSHLNPRHFSLVSQHVTLHQLALLISLQAAHHMLNLVDLAYPLSKQCSKNELGPNERSAHRYFLVIGKQHDPYLDGPQ